MTANIHWLDRYIAEQAAHYGMTPEAKARLFEGAATYAELLEDGLVDEPAPERDPQYQAWLKIQEENWENRCF